MIVYKIREKSYCVGCAIVVSGVARYVISGDQANYRMYHDFENTLEECSNKDFLGYCNGHEMSRTEFVKKYCNSVMPKRILDEI